MTTEQAEILKCRLKCLADMMLRQPLSGDIHALENIRHTACLLRQTIEDGLIEFDSAAVIVRRLEDQTVAIFKKRFS